MTFSGNIICVGILDDIIIYSADPAQHEKHVKTILQILRDNQLYEKFKSASSMDQE